MMYADDSDGRPFSKDPAVVRFNDRYYLYYSVRHNDRWAIGAAESRDLIQWTKIGVIDPSAPYEQKGICAPGALVKDGQVHLFYQRYGYGAQDAICHAFSSDGLHFERNPSNPIFHPTGDWNNGRAIDADVIEHQGRLLLYFATRDPAGKVQKLGVAAAPYDSDFSREQWKQLCSDSILAPELPWEKKCIEAPALCRRDGKLYMFYAGAYNNEPQQIGCAVSLDGVTWRRLFNEPFLTNGQPGEWNSSESGHPYAFEDDGGRTYLFYQGNNDKGKSWFLSQVEIGWKDGLPILLKSN
ncbi:MAG: family 43 glycosylhydrolase [Candidatus Omnitrophica bacterium]|nr:family 43 glycosylhydrolase [Candidatus Omnitrophota bacterium]